MSTCSSKECPEEPERALEKPSIELCQVEDDPKLWSAGKKLRILLLVGGASIMPMLSQSIYNPVLVDIQEHFGASDSKMALTVSLPILFQGLCPIFWTIAADLVGKKPIYLLGFSLGVIASAVASRAMSIDVLVGMRVLQFVAAAPMLSLGAGSLAECYDAHERGLKMGIYYAIPLMGPTIGPLLGGALGKAGGWRSTFYFLVAIYCLGLGGFLAFPEPWRKERSKVFQQARQKALSRAESLSGSTASIKIQDVNPVPIVCGVVRVPRNTAVLIVSGILFAAQYTILYTTTKTLSSHPYRYNSMEIGLVQMPFGIASMIGSVVGGKLCDRALGKSSEHEARIRAIIWAVVPLVLALAAYGWLAQLGMHVASLVVSLFVVGAFLMLMYSGITSYLVDCNAGNGSTVIAVNGLSRGILGCVLSQVAAPIRSAIGDGGLYSIIAGLVAGSGLVLLLVVKSARRNAPSI